MGITDRYSCLLVKWLRNRTQHADEKYNHGPGRQALSERRFGQFVPLPNYFLRRTIRELGRPDLLSLLIKFRHTVTSDPRDKVYSIAGVAKQSEPQLQINYSASWQEVFRDAAENIISSSGCLDILISSDATTDGLPSWVPDWLDPVKDHIMKDVFDLSLNCGPGSGEIEYPSGHYPMSDRVPSDMLPSIDENILTIYALEVGSISAALRVGMQALDGDGLIDAFERLNRLCLAGHEKESSRAKRTCCERQGIDIQFMMLSSAIPFRTPRSWLTNRGSARWSNFLRGKTKARDMAHRYGKDIAARIFQNRSIFKFETANGSLFNRLEGWFNDVLGVCRVDTRPGDAVFIVPGCSLALILRRNRESDYYRIIGASANGASLNRDFVKRLSAKAYRDTLNRMSVYTRE